MEHCGEPYAAWLEHGQFPAIREKTGNVSRFGRFSEKPFLKAQQFQVVPAIFPTGPNREFY
jgi:hypothetical protein